MGVPIALRILVFFLQWILQFYGASCVSWEEWWTYDGISGPAFWGLINPEWSLCNRGRRQSPVNLEPDKLLFDPNLRSLHIDKHRINGYIANTGHSVIFTVENTTRNHINVTGGPLSYRYQFQEMHMHYGLHDDSGSEHSINDYAFPAEIQIFGFNSQLYSNFSEALFKAQGIVAISLLLQLGDLSNPELRILTDQLEKIKYGGEEVEVKRLSIKSLLPETEYYMTYDGSTTMPACHETVTWVILNKPIYITKQQLHGLRRLMQGDAKHPKAPLGNNFRPPQPLHHRPIRTNIDFNSNKENGGAKYCPSMNREVYYKGVHNVDFVRSIYGCNTRPVIKRKYICINRHTHSRNHIGNSFVTMTSKHHHRIHPDGEGDPSEFWVSKDPMKNKPIRNLQISYRPRRWEFDKDDVLAFTIPIPARNVEGKKGESCHATCPSTLRSTFTSRYNGGRCRRLAKINWNILGVGNGGHENKESGFQADSGLKDRSPLGEMGLPHARSHSKP